MNERDSQYQKAKARLTALRGFYRHLVVYVAVNLGLFLINITKSPEYLWFYWPLMGWGIAVILNALRVFAGSFGSNWEQKKMDEFMRKES